ncbi:flagellar hook-basal body complex protein [Acidocella sp. KAb 2-4]|uniref:flagellar hook-basal body complex protein n=1 Tax=Acidocella sp. KAb 2-4 TaxID=2885158 RepID=UPI001D064D68|nr:flagellar hook-basal body complex protein [Acidocella sp. KAb 2-4]MCB5945808.1 flagellar hook-basal body complex protein [Acidocella sp. KAb 2-4]
MQTDSLYTGMAGLQAITTRMQAMASNLANLQTPGYAAVQTMTEASLYQGTNAPAGGDATALTPGPDLTQGPLNHTGDPMNVALSGDSWLQAQTSNGTALTRNGTLQISVDGILTDSAGNPILSAGGQPISLPPLTKLEISTDGTVSGVPLSNPSGPAQSYGQIGLVSTPTGTLTPLSGSLYSPPAGIALTPSADGALHQGYLNDSNADPTQSMIEMIDSSRSYQLQTDLMKTQSTASQGLNTLLAQG